MLSRREYLPLSSWYCTHNISKFAYKLSIIYIIRLWQFIFNVNHILLSLPSKTEYQINVFEVCCVRAMRIIWTETEKTRVKMLSKVFLLTGFSVLNNITDKYICIFMLPRWICLFGMRMRMCQVCRVMMLDENGTIIIISPDAIHPIISINTHRIYNFHNSNWTCFDDFAHCRALANALRIEYMVYHVTAFTFRPAENWNIQNIFNGNNIVGMAEMQKPSLMTGIKVLRLRLLITHFNCNNKQQWAQRQSTFNWPKSDSSSVQAFRSLGCRSLGRIRLLCHSIPFDIDFFNGQIDCVRGDLTAAAAGMRQRSGVLTVSTPITKMPHHRINFSVYKNDFCNTRTRAKQALFLSVIIFRLLGMKYNYNLCRWGFCLPTVHWRNGIFEFRHFWIIFNCHFLSVCRHQQWENVPGDRKYKLTIIR